MIEYINAIKRAFRDQYGFVPTGGTPEDPTFTNIPDSEYPMEIDGKVDHVKISGGKIHCCNFQPDPPKPLAKARGEQTDAPA